MGHKPPLSLLVIRKPQLTVLGYLHTTFSENHTRNVSHTTPVFIMAIPIPDYEIRAAREGDLPAILEISNYYVLNTVNTALHQILAPRENVWRQN